MARRIARKLFDEVKSLLDQGVACREIERRLPISHGSVQAIRAGTMQRPSEEQQRMGPKKSMFSVDYREVAPYRCDHGHRATTVPCVSCIALDAAARKVGSA